MLANSGLKIRLDENVQTMENLSSQVESLSSENANLRTQNEHLRTTIEEYQQRVRNYQDEIYELRRLANVTGNETSLDRTTSVSVLAPAVKAVVRTDPFWGTQTVVGYVGVPTILTLEAIPGKGRVLVNTEPAMGEVFQDTAVTAKETAEKISGMVLGGYDLIFSIQAQDKIPSVDGPSAGAAMAMLVLALMEGSTVNPGVAISGAISPDGKIGGVGGVIEKAQAASQAGASVFCIPRENEYTQVKHTQRIGRFTVYEYYTREKTADLIAEETDLQVILVSDIKDLVRIATYKDG